MPQFVGSYLGYLLAQAGLKVNEEFHQYIKSQGVALLTWRILASIHNEPTSVNELAKRVLVNQSTLSKALDRLEKDDLVSRNRDATQYRRVNVSITPKGTEIVKLIPIANEYEERAFEHMPAGERKKLKVVLQQLIDHHD